jgi:hypothetical protein
MRRSTYKKWYKSAGKGRGKPFLGLGFKPLNETGNAPTQGPEEIQRYQGGKEDRE